MWQIHSAPRRVVELRGKEIIHFPRPHLTALEHVGAIRVQIAGMEAPAKIQRQLFAHAVWAVRGQVSRCCCRDHQRCIRLPDVDKGCESEHR